MTYTTLSYHKNGYQIFLTLLLVCLLVFGSYTAQALDLEWAKRAGGIDIDESNGLAVDSTGNTYVTGYFTGSATFGAGESGETSLTSDGDRDIFVAKYTADGNLVWVKRAGGSDPDVMGIKIAVDGSGKAYVVGAFAESAIFGAGEANETTLTCDCHFGGGTFVAKYAADGDLIWAKPIVSQNSANVNDLAVDNSGNAYVTGVMFRTATFGFGETNEMMLTSNAHTNNMFIAKYTASGDLVWARKAGDNSGNTEAYSLAVDGSGNVYVIGNFVVATFGLGETNEITLTSDSTDIFVAKYTTGGRLAWVKRIVTSHSRNLDIAVDGSGNAYITGNGGGVFGRGEANETRFQRFQNDIFVAKYTTGGNLVWVRFAGGSGQNSASSLAADSSGNVYVTGVFERTATFGFGQDSKTILTSDGLEDIFVAKYTTDGDLISAKRAGGGARPDVSHGLALDTAGNVYITGSFAQQSGNFLFPQTAIFGAGENRETTLVSDGFGDIFVAKFSDDTLSNHPGTVETRITANSDDAEENALSGTVNLDSNDLEMAVKNNKARLVGMRFNGLNIPKDATITQAYLQFQVNDVNSERTDLTITGQATANAPTFTAANTNISSRIQTGAAVAWTPEPWNTIGEAGPDQKTPDIASVIQEIINQEEWSSGNSLAIIISGVGTRSAESYNGDVAAAPLLYVEYLSGTETNQSLVVDAGPDQTISLPNSASLDGAINNNGQPISPEVTTMWSQVSGPGTITFADSNAIDTTASFDLAGTYALQLTVDDGNQSDFNQLKVTVINQTRNWVWAKRVRGPGSNQDGVGSDLAVDGSGNSYVIGEFRNTSVFGGGEANETTLISNGDSDVFVAKYTVDGDLVWAKRAGGTLDVQGRSLALSDSGNVYVTGVFQGFATFGPGEAGETKLTSDGDRDIFVAKYTANGDLVWAKRAGGMDSDRGNSVAVDESDNAYLTGTITGIATFGVTETSETTLTSDGDSDLFVAKYTADGNLVWANHAGGTGSDNGNGLAVDSSGNVYVTGDFENTATFGAEEATETMLTSDGDSDVFVAKFTADGNLAWVKHPAALVNFGYGSDGGNDIALDSTGNAYITGYNSSGEPFERDENGEITPLFFQEAILFVAKYSAKGDLIWAKSAKSLPHTHIIGKSIAVDNSDNAYVTGFFNGDTAVFGRNEAGETLLIHNTLTRHIDSTFVAKYAASNGNLVFAKLVRGRRVLAGNGIGVDDSSNVYFTGSYSDTVIFAPGGSQREITLENDGPSNIFVAKLSHIFSAIPSTTLETRIVASSDDAEENITTGKVNLNSSILDLVDEIVSDFEGNRSEIKQLAGMRFTGLTIPQGATISNAYIQFTNTSAGIVSLNIDGEATDNALTFTNAHVNISSRDRTHAEVAWVPEYGAKPNRQTPNISRIIQKIINRPGWSNGNSLTIIITGSGSNNTVSYDGDPSAAPLLHVEYQ